MKKPKNPKTFSLGDFRGKKVKVTVDCKSIKTQRDFDLFFEALIDHIVRRIKIVNKESKVPVFTRFFNLFKK